MPVAQCCSVGVACDIVALLFSQVIMVLDPTRVWSRGRWWINMMHVNALLVATWACGQAHGRPWMA